MAHKSVSEFRARQDMWESRKRELLDKFVGVRDGFVSTLEAFAKEAVQADLEGTTALSRVQASDTFVEAKCTINTFRLVVLAADYVYPLEFGGREIAAKLFVYCDGNYDIKPFAELAVVASPDGSCTCQMFWFAKSGKQFITGQEPLSEDSGEQIAHRFIDHLFQFDFQWADKPTLGAMLKRGEGAASFGFKKKET